VPTALLQKTEITDKEGNDGVHDEDSGDEVNNDSYIL